MTGRLGNQIKSIAEQRVPRWTKDTAREIVANRFEDRIVTYGDLVDQDGIRNWRFGSKETFEFDRPEYYNDLPEVMERLVGEHVCHQPFVIEVPDVYLYDRNGFKLTDDGKYVVYNFLRENRDRSAAIELAYGFIDAIGRGSWPFAIPGRYRRCPEIDIAIPLLHRWATNYSHWTEEWLTQLEGLRHYVSETGNEPKIIVPPDPPAFVTASLEAFGYTEEDYLEWGHSRAKINRMVLPSIRRCRSGTSGDYIRDPSALRWVRDTVLEEVATTNTEGAQKYLISREDANTRRIVNRREVEEALSKRGFESVVLSEIDFLTQKRMFSNADMVVGTHGAGLTEFIYAPDAGVIELFGSYVTPVYFEMAKGLGMRYGCLACEPMDDDLRVDVAELLNAVDVIEGA